MNVEKSEVRIRRVFGLPRDKTLPEVELESLKTYQRYIETHLKFPFMVEFERETGPWEFVQVKIRVRSLADIDELGNAFYLTYRKKTPCESGEMNCDLPNL